MLTSTSISNYAQELGITESKLVEFMDMALEEEDFVYPHPEGEHQEIFQECMGLYSKGESGQVTATECSVTVTEDEIKLLLVIDDEPDIPAIRLRRRAWGQELSGERLNSALKHLFELGLVNISASPGGYILSEKGCIVMAPLYEKLGITKLE